MPKNNKTLTTMIKEYRNKNNVSQRDLAEAVGVRRETIVRLEQGAYNPSLELAYDIAVYFNATVEDLFHFS